MVSSSKAPTARAGSTARTIQKRRDKPFKTEKNRVITKKGKLNLGTTFQEPPPGFTFIPVGTPDLADRCKELSRLRNYPVNIVNTDPRNRFQRDREKISAHILRIGYQFRTEVVDEACRELHYVFHRGKFVKEDELMRQSILARTMINHGLQPMPGVGLAPEGESNEQIRAAVKELFPKIPDMDLENIITHAWAKGSSRVGTAPMLSLARRVQLATIARIRHEYTDYDRLLRAFPWQDARALVELPCVRKLLEWRGEDEDDNDEEILREVIVIDDDDESEDNNFRGHALNHDHNKSEIEPDGEESDSSIELTYRPAANEDFGAESHDERSLRVLDRLRPRASRNAQRDANLRLHIERARQQRRDVPGAVSVCQVNVPDDQVGNEFIVVNGQRYRRAATGSSMIGGQRLHDTPLPTFEAGKRHGENLYSGAYQGYQDQVEPRIAQSIETSKPYLHPHGNAAYTHPRMYPLHGQSSHSSEARAAFGPPVVDLTSEQQSRHQQVQDGYRGVMMDLTRDQPPHLQQAGSGFAPPVIMDLTSTPPRQIHGRIVDLTGDSPRHSSPYRGPVDGQIAPIQYVSLQPRHPADGNGPPQAGTAQPRVVFLRPMQPQHTGPLTQYAPQALYPVHGAPAPIQQVPPRPRTASTQQRSYPRT